jgi:hypothetical protein
MTDRPREQADSISSTDQAALQSLQQEIRLHQRHDASKSVLNRGLSAVWDRFQEETSSVETLKSFYRDAERKLATGDAEAKAQTVKEIARVVEADRKALESRETATHYAGGFLKTAGLFLQGRIGLASTVGVYALDQWNPNASWQGQIADVSLGGLKGGGMKAMFHALGHHSQTAMAKGVMLGMGNSVLDVGLSRQTYNHGLFNGLGDTLSSAADLKARAIDGAVFVASEGMFRGGNYLTRGAVKESPMLSTMFTGTAFGMSSGGVGEYMRQKSAGEEINLNKIVEHAAIQGLIDTAAASFGGLQADRQLRARLGENIQRMNLNLRDRATELKHQVLNATDSLINGSQWTPALAGIPNGFGESVRPAETSRPVNTARPESAGARPQDLVPTVLHMSSNGLGHGDNAGRSGANIDNLVSGSGRGDSPSAVRRPEGTAATPPAKVVIEVPNDLVPAANELNRLARKLIEPTAGEAEKEAVVACLKSNPRLREFAIKLAEVKNNQALSEVVRDSFDVGSLPALRTYRTILGDKSTHELWDELKSNFFPALRMEKHSAGYQSAVRTYLEMYPELKPATEAFARKCADLAIVESLDVVLGTSHAQNLRAKILETTQGQPQPPAAPEIEAKDDGGVPKTSKPAAIVSELPPEVDRKGPVATPEKAASEPIVPQSASDRLFAERINSLTVGTPAEKSAAARALAPEVDKLNDEGFLRWMQAIDSPEAMALGLESTKSSRVSKVMSALGDRLFELSDQTFLRWKEVAVNKLLDGWKLESEAFDSLPISVQKEFLSKIPSLEAGREQQWRSEAGNSSARYVPAEATAPEWAKDATIAGREQQDQQRDRQQDRGQKWRQPWKPRFFDTLDNRIDLMVHVVEAMQAAPASITPELKQKVLRLGAADKEGLIGVLDAVGYRQAGRDAPYSWVEGDPRVEANRRLLAELAPQAQNMEPLKYLFQFLRERNSAGAYAAAQEMQPPSAAPKKLSEILDELVTAKKQAGEPVDDGQVEVEARQRLSQLTRDANQHWTEVRKLLSDLASGRIQSPRPGEAGAGNRQDGRPAQSESPAKQEPVRESQPLAEDTTAVGPRVSPAPRQIADADFVLQVKPERPFQYNKPYEDLLVHSAEYEFTHDGRKAIEFPSQAHAEAFAKYVSKYFQAVMPADTIVAMPEQMGRIPEMRIAFKGTGIGFEGPVVLDANGSVIGLAVSGPAGEPIFVPARSPKTASRRNNGQDILLDYGNGKTITIPAESTHRIRLEKPPEAKPEAMPEAKPEATGIPEDDASRLRYVRQRVKASMPNNAVTAGRGPNGELITVNNSAADDGAFRRTVELAGQYIRYEFKNGDVITRFADKSYEVSIVNGPTFKLEGKPATPQPAPPAPPEQITPPPAPPAPLEQITPQPAPPAPPEQIAPQPAPPAPPEKIAPQPAPVPVEPPQPEARKAGELPAAPAAEVNLFAGVAVPRKLRVEVAQKAMDWFESMKDSSQFKMFRDNEEIKGQGLPKGTTVRQLFLYMKKPVPPEWQSKLSS